MFACQLAIGNVFDDNDNVDVGNGGAHEISQKQGSQQNSLCVSAGKSAPTSNNLSGQTHTNTVDNTADQQGNDIGICSPSQADRAFGKVPNYVSLYSCMALEHPILYTLK
jgi:hypothetical protein